MKGWRPRYILEPIEIGDAELIFVAEEPITKRYWAELDAAERSWVHRIHKGVEELAQKTAWEPAERRYWRRINLTECPSEAAALYMAVWMRDCGTFSRTLLIRDGNPALKHEISYMLQLFWPIEWEISGEEGKEALPA